MYYSKHLHRINETKKSSTTGDALGPAQSPAVASNKIVQLVVCLLVLAFGSSGSWERLALYFVLIPMYKISLSSTSNDDETKPATARNTPA